MSIDINLKDIVKTIRQLEEQHRCISSSVRLLAVSKTQSIAEIEEAIHAGQFAFGENYVQEAIEKIRLINQKYVDLEWHYIGRIQKNKINDLVQYFDWLQTIENTQTAARLNNAREKYQRKLNVCLQVNISDEAQKGGLKLNDVPALAKYVVEECRWLNFRGLMAIGLATEESEALKTMFAQLRCCYEDLQTLYASVDTLSMGMSSDMALAIECGSTMVRVGTAIFGRRER